MLWAKAHGGDERARAPAMDEELHAERVDGERNKRMYRARRADVPNGAFVRYAVGEGDAAPRPYLVLGQHLLPWDARGYTALVSPSAITEEVEVLTPPSIVAVLSAGYHPMLHPSAAALLG